MKKLPKIFGLLAIVAFIFTSCSKDDNPADNNLFAGTYDGSIGYNNGETNISSEDGSVFVTKVGNKYNFNFSNDDIPNISGIEFEKNDESYINIGGGETSYIKIDENSLNILYSVDSQTWTANCSR